MALPILDGNQSATTLSTILDSGQHIPAHTVVSLGSTAISNITNAVSGSVVSISNFPASQTTTFGAVTGSVSVLNFPSTQTIAGTVTANVPLLGIGETISDSAGLMPSYGVQMGYTDTQNSSFELVADNRPLPISGTVTANIGQTLEVSEVVRCGKLEDGEGLVFGLDRDFPISGTVTVGAMPSGALTTRFGSVTTANTAQITSAVTNTSRKYLLAQNISAGTVTIGIGFSPTTTQGIQLPAGGGLTFDSFCPTGAVYWLGAVTGAAFTILEG